MSLFREHILHVFKVGSRPEMASSSAGWVIAFVENAKIMRYIPLLDKPCNLMRLQVKWFSIVRSCVNYAVTVFIDVAAPYPARPKFWGVWWDRSIFVHIFPESDRQGFRKALRRGGVIGKLKLHSISLVDCLPRLRLFVQRGANFLYSPRSSRLNQVFL